MPVPNVILRPAVALTLPFPLVVRVLLMRISPVALVVVMVRGLVALLSVRVPPRVMVPKAFIVSAPAAEATVIGPEASVVMPPAVDVMLRALVLRLKVLGPTVKSPTEVMLQVLEEVP